LLRAGVGDGAEARPGATAEHESLHEITRWFTPNEGTHECRDCVVAVSPRARPGGH
jgi:hypothetical protein